MIKTEQLRYLVELEKTNSFHKCAENLYLSQPAISLSIRNLEKELGVSLFERTSSGVYPTEIGRKIIQQAKNILTDIELLYQFCQEQALEQMALPLKELHISSSQAFFSAVMPFWLPLLHKSFVGTNFLLHIHTKETIFPFLLNSPYNIGIYYLWDDDCQTALQQYPNLKATRLFKVSFQLAIAKTASFDLPQEIDLTQNSTYKSPVPYVSYTGSVEVSTLVQQRLLEKLYIQPILEAPVPRLFNAYVSQGLAAGIIMKLGIGIYLSSMDKKQLTFIPIKTEKECILYLFSNQELPNPVYQAIFQHLQTCFSQL